MKTTSCPDKESLFGYVVGTIPETKAEAVTAHLAICQECQETVEALEGLSDTMLSALRQPAEGDAFADEPECQQVLKRLRLLQLGKSESASPAAVAAPPAPKQTSLKKLGDYELLEKLGEGGMGAVYKARHARLKKIVALKVLPKNRLDNEDAVARFEREIEAVGRLEHPNIVRAMDAREVGGMRFLVMEYVDGLDLSEVVRRNGPLGIADASEAIRQAAMGLGCSLENDLVHRDIKPSNLMLSSEGQVKILDLGLAQIQEADSQDSQVTGAGQVMGTPDYISPEQAEESHAVDVRTDIYSLGCTLYYLLTGRPPFDRPTYDTPMKKVMGHVRDGVPSVLEKRLDIPKPIAALLERMVAKDPEQRLSRPSEVVNALSPFCEGSKLIGLLREARRKGEDVEEKERPINTEEFRISDKIETSQDGLKPAASMPEAAEPVAPSPPEVPPIPPVAGAFDPYHIWLGIPPAEQPANHYRMLGLSLFESNSEAIRDAAARQMAHVRSYHLGQHAELSQKILNELGAAQACLLNPQKKAAYDAELRKKLAAPKVVPPANSPALPPKLPEPAHISTLDDLKIPEITKTRFPISRSWFGNRKPPLRYLVAAGGTAAFVLLLGIVISIATEKGSVKIELSDPKAKVDIKVDGDTIELAGLDEPLYLKPGEHELVVTGKGFKAECKKFTVQRGNNPILEVTLTAIPDPPIPPNIDSELFAHWTFDDRANPGRDETGNYPLKFGDDPNTPNWISDAKVGKGAMRWPKSKTSYGGIGDVLGDQRLTPRKLTFATWFRPTEDWRFSGEHCFIWCKPWDNYGGNGWYVCWRDDSDFQLIVNGLNGFRLRLPHPFEKNVWTHLVLTFDSDTKQFIAFQDGKLIPPDQVVTWNDPKLISSLPNDKVALRVGHNGYWEGVSLGGGDLDDMRIYNRVLNFREVTELTKYQPSPNPNPLPNNTVSTPSNLSAEKNAPPTMDSKQNQKLIYDFAEAKRSGKWMRINLPLFDGKTLGGWHVIGPGKWTVENGAIVGRKAGTEQGQGCLVSDLLFDDFTLQMKFKITRGDSGVYFRGVEGGKQGFYGLQVQIKPPDDVGGIIELLSQDYYATVKTPSPFQASGRMFKPNEWNDLELTAQSGNISIRINGAMTSAMHDTSSNKEGKIAIQLFGNEDTEVSVKDIQIQQETGTATVSTSCMLTNPTVAMNQSNAKEIDLLKLVDPAKDAVLGKWSFVMGSLECEPLPAARIEIPYDPPEEYDYRLVFVSDRGDECVQQICRGGGSQFGFIVGGWRNTIAGFHLIDGKFADHNLTTTKANRWIVPGKRHVSVVKVRKDVVEGWFDDKRIVGFKPDWTNMSLEPTIKLRRSDVIGIEAYDGVRVESATITEITGEGKMLRKQTVVNTQPSSLCLGYNVGEPVGEDTLSQFAKYTNVVLDYSWGEFGDGTILAAKKSGMKVVLGFREKHGEDSYQSRAVSLAQRHQDVVAAVCWSGPNYRYNTATELSTFARRLKAAVPGIEFWCDYVETPRGDMVPVDVPDEVDRFIVTFYCSPNTREVEKRELLILPKWLQKAHGRPVMLGWSVWDVNPPGIAAKCEPGTIRRCAQIVRDYHLGGLVIGNYGKSEKYEGVETNSNLVKEIEEVAKELIGADRTATGNIRVKELVNAETSNKPEQEAMVGKKTQPPRWLGYEPGKYSNACISELAGHSNLIVASMSSGFDEKAIQVAKQKGLKVLFWMEDRDGMALFLREGIPLAKRYPDVVVGVMDCLPNYLGVKPSELAEFSRNVKQAMPTLEFWVSLADSDNNSLTFQIPDEVDVLVIHILGCFTVEKVNERVKNLWPMLVAKAGDRPSAFFWDGWEDKNSGAISKCELGMFQAIAKAVEKFNMRGAIFWNYQDQLYKGNTYTGVSSRPELVSEIKNIAKDWGVTSNRKLDRKRTSPISQSPNAKPKSKQPSIPDGAVEFEGHYYKIIDTPMTWHLAKEYCEKMGGHLARIESDKEQEFVQTLLGNNSNAFYFIDGTDEEKEGDWRFSDGKPIQYTNWEIKQPDNYLNAEHYLRLLGANRKWTDMLGDARAPFICEWDQLQKISSKQDKQKRMPINIPKESVNFKGHHYLLVDTPATWHVAKRKCEIVGGHLVRIQSSEEQTFIEELLKSCKGDRYWADGSDANIEGVWENSDGIKLTYFNWENGEPNNWNIENELFISKNGRWGDQFCGNRVGYICEWDR